MATIGISEVQISGLGRDAQSAFYAADAGSECAMYWDLQKNIFNSGDVDDIECGGSDAIKVSANTFKVKFGAYCAEVSVTKTGGKTDITSTGYRSNCSNEPENVLLARKVKTSYSVCTDPLATNVGESGTCIYGPPPPPPPTGPLAFSCTVSGLDGTSSNFGIEHIDDPDNLKIRISSTVPTDDYVMTGNSGAYRYSMSTGGGPYLGDPNDVAMPRNTIMEIEFPYPGAAGSDWRPEGIKWVFDYDLTGRRLGSVTDSWPDIKFTCTPV
jgi:hypothetical protein